MGNNIKRLSQNRFFNSLTKLFCLIFLLSQNSFAADEKHHSANHETQIYHAFTFEGEVGEAKDGRSKSFDLDGWIGGDYNRLWINLEKKDHNKYEKKFEVEALYSRNISQFWDGQIGVSRNFSVDSNSDNLNYFVVGIEGLAPQFFETKAHIFLSEKGNFSAIIKQEIDIFLTQKLITQPYFETEIFAQNINESEEKKGIADFEFGLVTRYEITRKFAPYFALRYHTKTFATANYAEKIGEKINNFIISGGVRLKF